MKKEFENINISSEVIEKTEIFKNLFEVFSVPMAVISLKGKIVKANKTFCELLDFEEHELLKMKFTEFTHPDDIENKIHFIKQLISGKEKSLQVEKRFIKKNGGLIWVNISLVLLRDSFGNAQFFAGTVEDITKRKKAESDLIENEKRYRYLAENIADVVWILDVSTMKFKYVSPSVYKLRGFTAEEVMNQTIDQVVMPESLELIQKSLPLRVESYLMGNPDSPTVTEISQPCKDGSIVFTEVTTTLVGDINSGLQVLGVSRNIDERKKSEALLKTSEERYRRFFEEDLTGDFLSALDGTLLMCNEAFVKILKYKSKEEVLNKNTADFYWEPSDRIDFLKELKEKRQITNLELVLKASDGSKVYIVENVIGIFDEKGELKEISGYMFDITERKNAEDRIFLLSRAVENSPASVMITDEHGNIEYVNNKFLDLTGYSLEEIKGQNPRILKSGKMNKLEYKILWETITSGKEWRGEFHNKKKNGDLYWESAIIVPIRNGKTYFLAVKEDITARKRTEELLKLNEEKYRKIFENVQDVFYQTDSNGYIIEISPSISKFTGYKREEMLNTHISRLYFEPENRNEFLRHLKVTGEVEDFETQIKTKFNKLIYASINAHFRYNDSKQIIGTEGSIRNINERKTAELELIKEKEKAEQSDKLKTEFLAQMSHEIRTPLNAMLNYSYYIMEEINEKTKLDVSEFFEGMNRAGKRIIKTIESILSMSSIQVGSFENTPAEIDLCKDVLEHIYIDFHPLAKEKGLILSAEKRTDNTSVFVDGFVSTKIFENLLDNAIKFTKAGYVKIIVSRNESGNLIVEVSDSGIGISEEYLRKLFTPFSQEDQSYSRQYDGTGLGLALVKKYCDMNNILIDIQSKKGIGTQAVLTFQLN